MNKKIKILIVGLAILFASNVKALNFNDFRLKVISANDETINLSDYLDANNTLLWQSSALTFGADKIFVGLRGSDFAILRNNYPALNLRGFNIDGKTVHFYDNFAFMKFSAGEFPGNNAITVKNNANVSFTTAVFIFDGNRSGVGGAIHVSEAAVNFIRSSVTFSNNSGYALNDAKGGGAISALINSLTNNASNASINFTSSVVIFSSNVSSYGGAIGSYYDPSQGPIHKSPEFNFISSTVTFTKNYATRSLPYGGGAVFAHLSTINFINSTVHFTSNARTYQNIQSFSMSGGAIYAIHANINFINSEVDFTSNTLIYLESVIYVPSHPSPDTIGGAIFAGEGANIQFANTRVNFTGNAVWNRGGAIFAQGDPTIKFTDSEVNFINNSVVLFNDDRIPSYTIAYSHPYYGNGGAIYMEAYDYQASQASIEFTRSTVNFEGNISFSSGGAIAVFGWREDRGYIEFTNSKVNFTRNQTLNGKGSAIYLELSTISFINTETSFVRNTGSAAIWAKASQINISGNMDFRENTGDIMLEGGSSLVFFPEGGSRIRFKGKITASDNGNIIRKKRGGTVVFDKAAPISLANVDFLIEEGTALFEVAVSTFKNLNISQGGTLGISIDFAALAGGGGISAFFINSITIADEASLSVQPLNERAVEATSVPFVYVSDQYSGVFADIVGGNNYFFSWEDYGNYAKVGFLRFEGIADGGGSGGDGSGDDGTGGSGSGDDGTGGDGSGDDGTGGSGSGDDGLGGDGPGNGGLGDVESNAWASPSNKLTQVFIANTIRQAAISDNSPIYSNVKERVWVAGQFSGGSLSDDLEGKFDSSVAGAKAGFAFVSGADFSAGAFAGFASRSYKQGDNKATASDMDFGLYGGLGLGGNVSLAAFVGYGLQSINAKNAGDKADFDATIIKFGFRAEYKAGLISPFIGFEGAVVDVGDIDLKADGQGLKMDAVSYTRLSSQIGAKIGRNVGGFSWYGKAYVDLLLSGNKPEYSVKSYYENDEAKTKAAKSRTIDATEESAASFGLGAGLSIPVSAVVNIFASAETKLNADFFGYQGNIGASFKF